MTPCGRDQNLQCGLCSRRQLIHWFTVPLCLALSTAEVSCGHI